MRTRPTAVVAALLLASVALPASAELTAGEGLAFAPGGSWVGTRSDIAIGDDGTLAWVSTRRVDGQDDVMVRMRASHATTWTAPVRLDPAGVDVGAGPRVEVDGSGRAVVAWVEEPGTGADPVVVRRVDADGAPGPRQVLTAGPSAPDGAPDGGRELALDTSAAGEVVVGFSDDAAGGAPAAATIDPDGAVGPWRHLRGAGTGAAASLDVAVDEAGRTWAAWTAPGAGGGAVRGFVARLVDGEWVSRELPGGGTSTVELESGQDVTALAWAGDGDGDSASDDVLTLTHDATTAPVDVPTGWDPVADARRGTLLHRSSPLLAVHRGRAWLATRSLPGADTPRTVDVRSTADGVWGPASAIPTQDGRDASAHGWLVTGEPARPLLAVGTIRPGGSTAYRLDFFGPRGDGGWASQRTVTPVSTAHAVRVADSGAAHGPTGAGFVVVTDDTDQPDRSSLLRYSDVAAPPVTTVAALPTWSLGTAGVTWTTDVPADLTELRLRRAGTRGGFDAGTTTTTSTAQASPYVVGPLAPGQTGCVAARSRTSVADFGPWSAERCTATPLDDRGLTRSSGWSERTGTAYYRGTARTATRRGSSLTTTVADTRRLALVASTCRTCGRVRVLLGSTSLATLSLAAPARHRRVLPVATFGAPRSGTVRVTVVTAGRRVVVDGLAVSRR